MGGENHLDRLVDVAPLRVMVALFGDQSRTAHEAEGLVEILEHKGPLDRLAAGDLVPARQALEGRFPRFCRQSLHHDGISLFQARQTTNTDRPDMIRQNRPTPFSKRARTNKDIYARGREPLTIAKVSGGNYDGEVTGEPREIC